MKAQQHFTPFTEFKELFADQHTKKAASALQESAKKWFTQCYGAIFDYGEGNRPLWKYQAGMLILYIPNYGSYYYKHIIKALHYYAWNVKEFWEGYKYYKKYNPQRDVHRDDNPYPECNFYAYDAWDDGFLYAMAKDFKRFSFPNQVSKQDSPHKERDQERSVATVLQ